MNWDYRLVLTRDGGKEQIGVFEVYYDADGKPICCTKESACGEFDSREKLIAELVQMLAAAQADRRVLEYDMFVAMEAKDAAST